LVRSSLIRSDLPVDQLGRENPRIEPTGCL
jgi:hypothetical protein